MGNDALKDKFANFLQFKIVEQGQNYALVKGEVEDEFLNGLGMVHGGFIFSLADYAFALASNSIQGRIAVSISANIQYMHSCKEKEIYAQAKLITESKKTGLYNVSVYTCKKEKIAYFTGLAYYKFLTTG